MLTGISLRNTVRRLRFPCWPCPWSQTQIRTPAPLTNLFTVNNLGPQLKFPVSEGILNYRGMNTVALSIWALDPRGAKLDGFALVSDAVVETSMSPVQAVEQPEYMVRDGAY